MVERALQMAEGCIENIENGDYARPRNTRAFKEKLHPEDFLANIFHFRICSYTEQIAMINHLDKWVTEHKDVGIKFMHTTRILSTSLLEYLRVFIFCNHICLVVDRF